MNGGGVVIAQDPPHPDMEIIVSSGVVAVRRTGETVQLRDSRLAIKQKDVRLAVAIGANAANC
jgi:hypothetical protein